MKSGVVIFCALVCNIAPAQIHTGSVAIFIPSRDEFVIAADSRAGTARGSLPPSDNNCKIAKIAALQGNVVFSTTGNVGFLPGPGSSLSEWNNVGEANRAAQLPQTKTADAQTFINVIADNWAQSLQKRWVELYLQDPGLVTKAVQSSNQGITSGIFAVAANGEIAFAIRNLVLDSGKVKILPSECMIDHVCGSGHTDVLFEFARQTSPRARIEEANWAQSLPSRSLSSSIDKQMLIAIHFVELTISYDKSGTVGGDVDALELWKDGTIHWIQRKQGCEEREK